ncbi:hypothetical protein RTR00_004357 [Salmonella enterica]|nr:hypothetical protein [Salmonella enterica]
MKKIKSNQRRYLLSGSITFLALLPVTALALGPGCQTGDSYTTDKGRQNIRLPLAPAEINLNKDTAVGTVVYEAELPHTQVTCRGFPGRQPALHTGNGYDQWFSYLQQAGLEMQLTIPGKNPWVPGTTPEFLPFASPYTSSEPRTDTFPGGKLQLIMKKNMDKPIKVSIPQADNIIDIMVSNTQAVNVVSFGSANSTWINAIPKCIGKTSVPAEIDLGRVITGGQGSLPSPRDFYIRPSFNRDCEGFSDINGWGGFALNLDIQFEVNNTGDLTSDHTRVRLKSKSNTDAVQDNGLLLVIKKDGAIPVKFNEWEKVNQAISTINNPLNLLYSASLEPVQGGDITSAKPGKFSQQVTVKVRYE